MKRILILASLLVVGCTHTSVEKTESSIKVKRTELGSRSQTNVLYKDDEGKQFVLGTSHDQVESMTKLLDTAGEAVKNPIR